MSKHLIYPKDRRYPAAANECIEEIIAVCRRHGFSLSHEDGHGSFVLEVRTNEQDAEGNEDWLRGAPVETK